MKKIEEIEEKIETFEFEGDSCLDDERILILIPHSSKPVWFAQNLRDFVSDYQVGGREYATRAELVEALELDESDLPSAAGELPAAGVVHAWSFGSQPYRFGVGALPPVESLVAEAVRHDVHAAFFGSAHDAAAWCRDRIARRAHGWVTLASWAGEAEDE